jgi:hypothetical protein
MAKPDPTNGDVLPGAPSAADDSVPTVSSTTDTTASATPDNPPEPSAPTLEPPASVVVVLKSNKVHTFVYPTGDGGTYRLTADGTEVPTELVDAIQQTALENGLVVTVKD